MENLKEPVLVNSSMQHAIDEYLMMLQVESGCAANTLAAYRRDLRKLVDFFQQEGIPDVSALTKPLWVQFLGSLQASGLSASSIARCLAAVRGFYKHVGLGRGNGSLEGVLKGTPKQWTQLPKLLSEAEVTRLLNLPAMDHREDRRDAAMVELLYATGLRVSEFMPQAFVSRSWSPWKWRISTWKWGSCRLPASATSSELCPLGIRHANWSRNICSPLARPLSKSERLRRYFSPDWVEA